jgi:hypothetical protein
MDPAAYTSLASRAYVLVRHNDSYACFRHKRTHIEVSLAMIPTTHHKLLKRLAAEHHRKRRRDRGLDQKGTHCTHRTLVG